MAANEAPTGQQPARCHQQRHGILPVCAPELCSATLPPTPVPLLEVNPRKFSDPDSWDCSRIGGWGLGHLWGSDRKKGECPSLTDGVEWRTEWRLPGELVQWWTQRPQAWAQVALTHVLAHHTWGLRQPPHVVHSGDWPAGFTWGTAPTTSWQEAQKSVLPRSFLQKADR